MATQVPSNRARPKRKRLAHGPRVRGGNKRRRTRPEARFKFSSPFFSVESVIVLEDTAGFSLPRLLHHAIFVVFLLGSLVETFRHFVS